MSGAVPSRVIASRKAQKAVSVFHAPVLLCPVISYGRCTVTGSPARAAFWSSFSATHFDSLYPMLISPGWLSGVVSVNSRTPAAPLPASTAMLET